MSDFSVSGIVQSMDRMTDEVKREMSILVDRAAQRTQSRVQSRYPVGPTGKLRSLIRILVPSRYASTGVMLTKQVKATAPHLYIWQEGTVPRYDSTRKNAYRGVMPKGGRVFQAEAAAARAQMLSEAQSLLSRNRKL